MEGLNSPGIARWMRWMAFGRRLGCHQMAERSFFIKGYQFPVCARCTGVILGQTAGVIGLICGLRLHFVISCLLLIPMAVDWGLQFLKILMSTNGRRLISGLISGFGLTYVYAAFLALCYEGILKVLQ